MEKICFLRLDEKLIINCNKEDYEIFFSEFRKQDPVFKKLKGIEQFGAFGAEGEIFIKDRIKPGEWIASVTRPKF